MKLRLTILLAFATVLTAAIGAVGAMKAEASGSACPYAVGDARRHWCKPISHPWVPGTAYYTDELSMDDNLERTYDFAYCHGIRRFGHGGGSSLTESFHVFDCTTQLNDTYCVHRRFKLIKAKRKHWYRTIMTRSGYCY